MTTEYEIDSARIAYREDGYNKFWQREPNLVLHQTDDAIPHIDTYRFPVKEDTLMGEYTIYLTGGMSDVVQPQMEEEHEIYQRMEISAFAPKIVMNDSGKTDFIGWIVGWMAHYPFEQDTYFLQGQTFDWGKPITRSTEMHGFYFAHLPFVDEEQLCSLSGTAKSILHLVTLSKNELEYKMENGTDALLEHLASQSVPPLFDLERKSTI